MVAEDDEDAGVAGDDVDAGVPRAAYGLIALGPGLHPDVLDSELGGLLDDGLSDMGRSDDGDAVDGFGERGEAGIGEESFDVIGVGVDGIDGAVVLPVYAEDLVAVLVAVGRGADHGVRGAVEEGGDSGVEVHGIARMSQRLGGGTCAVR